MKLYRVRYNVCCGVDIFHYVVRIFAESREEARAKFLASADANTTITAIEEVL